jgi:hypothetical protein
MSPLYFFSKNIITASSPIIESASYAKTLKIKNFKNFANVINKPQIYLPSKKIITASSPIIESASYAKVKF